MDLILRGATFADGRTDIDIAVKDGKIAAVETNIGASAGREIDVTGRLVTPPFVDPHFHMDGTLTYGYPRYNESGTLLEGIELWRDLKPSLSHDWYIARALEYCDWAVGHGLLAIRSHVDTTDPTLGAVTALVEVRERIKDYIDLQLVAFPQDGYLRSPIGVENMTKALDMGVDVIGGIPHFERTMEQGAESLRQLCALAAERDLRVDIHCDETDDPLSRHIETLAAETVRLGLEGRVTGSHLSSMHSMDDYYVSKLIPLMIEADIQVIANPTANMLLMGRHDAYPKRRGMTRVKELMLAQHWRRARRGAYGGACRAALRAR
jgi:cytosine deaminase